MKRLLNFDAMEQRIAMSAGLGFSGAETLPAHWIRSRASIRSGRQWRPPIFRGADPTGLAHTGVVAAKQGAPITGSFKGGQSELIAGGSLVYMTGSSGKIGNVAFGEHAGGESGDSFLGSALNLSNSQGSMTLNLEDGTLKNSGKDEDLKVIFIIDTATGASTSLPKARQET